MEIMRDITKFSSGIRSMIVLEVVDQDILSNLADDKDMDVRIAVAKNRNTSTHTLFKLRSDKEWYVRNEAKKNLMRRGWSIGET